MYSIRFDNPSHMMATGHRAVIVILVVFAASSESCDETNTIHNENEQIWERIWSTHPTPGTESLVDGINVFFDQLRMGVHNLVVLIERSEKLERGEFYLRQRKLVEDIIRYHVAMRGANPPTHTTVITYGHKDSFTKFEGNDKNIFLSTSWPMVTYKPGEADGNVDIRLAFQVALRDVFQNSRGTGMMLVLSSGEFIDAPAEITLTDLADMMVNVYVVPCGTTSEEASKRLQKLASDPGFYKSFEKWMNASWVNTPREGVTPNAGCGPHGWGYVNINSNLYPACRCAWGYKGDLCKEDEDECAFQVCGANGDCWDGTALFECRCQNSTTCGCYCNKPCVIQVKDEWWPALVIALASLVLLAVIIVIVLVATVLWHQKNTQHPSNASVAPPQHTARWFVQQFFVIVTTGCRHDSPGDTASDVGMSGAAIEAGPGSKASKGKMSSLFFRPPRPSKTPAIKPPAKIRKQTVPDDDAFPKRRLPPMPTSENIPSTREPPKNIKETSAGNKDRHSQPDYEEVISTHGTQVDEVEDDIPYDDTECSGIQPRKSAAEVDEVEDEVDELSSTTDSHDIPYDETEGIYVPRPPEALPDLQDGEAQNTSIDQLEWYGNVLKDRDMKSWSSYLLQVLYTGRLDNVTITRNDQRQYISSSEHFLLTLEEFTLLLKNLTDGAVGLCFKFKDRYFVMREAEQTHFVAVHDGAKEVLCVAKTDRFLVVGKRPTVSERSKILCRQNVKYICEHLV